MISDDWKKRLRADSLDYIKNKLPLKEYDFDIIYNAYPIRINGEIPKNVLEFVANTMAGSFPENYSDYQDFYSYLWEKKGTSGKIVFSIIMDKLIVKYPEDIFDLITLYLNKYQDNEEISHIVNKPLFTYMKKISGNNFQFLVNLLKKPSVNLIEKILQIILKYEKIKKDFLKLILPEIENLWLILKNSEQIKNYAKFLKQVIKIDKEIYINLFEKYQNSKNPNVILILCTSINFYNETIYSIIENWTKSGNLIVKKNALQAQKLLKRKKK